MDKWTKDLAALIDRVRVECPNCGRPAGPILGRKDDAGKPRWDLLPVRSLKEIVKVLTFGATKYAPDNWQHVEDPINRYYRAAYGHIQDWRDGERNDAESGIHHLAHAACCLLFLLWFELREE